MKRLPLIFLALALAGCVRFEPKPISPTDSAARLGARRLDDARLRKFLEQNLHREFTHWPAERWDFNMLVLAAFYYHPGLDVARAQWHVAQAGIQTAGGIPNPTLTVTPGYSANPADGVSPWFPAIDFDLPIETAGKRGKRIAVAQHLSESARLNLATTAWQVRSRLRAALIERAAAGRRARWLQEPVAVQEQIVRRLEQQAELGAISGYELSSARIALQKTRLDLNDAQSQLADATAGVAAAIGIPAHAMDEVELAFDPLQDWESPVALTSTEIQSEALRSRTDILGALAEYAAAEDALRLEIARQYPDVHLNPGYQFDQGEHKWSLGLSVELPVLNRNQGPIAEAGARREEAAARFNELQANVQAEIERATAVFRASQKNFAALQSLAEAQAKQRASVEQQFETGAADRLEVLNARLELAASELAQIDGLVKLQQAAGALEDAVQRPLTGDLLIGGKAPERSEIQTQSLPGKENNQ
jgi:outer membrane protein, heavy metal efflux system